MTEPDKCVWVKRHKPSNTWYVLRDWMYGGKGVESSFDDIDDAIARAREVAAEHGVPFRIFGAPPEGTADKGTSDG